MKKKISIAIVVSGLMMSQAAVAENISFEQDRLYAGGGLGFNFPDSSGLDNAVGFQVFGGYDLDLTLGGKVGTAVEVGYATSGDFEIKDCNSAFGSLCDGASADGIYANAVFKLPLDNQLGVLGRIGFDFGDDDGLMLGFGGSYHMDERITFRAEYVIRDNYSSLQGNVVYNF